MLYDAYSRPIARRAGFVTAGYTIIPVPQEAPRVDCISGQPAVTDGEESIEYCGEFVAPKADEPHPKG